MNYTVRPIDVWPGTRTAARKTSPFSASWSETSDLLTRELRQLRASHVVLQLAITESDLTLAGWIRANARPSHPGVIVAFESKYGPLKYSTDVFHHWQANVRAIALGLEALRKVDRYGITKRGEQYTGWKALGGATPMPAGGGAFASIEDAIAFLHEHAPGIEWDHDDRDAVTRAYRAAAKRLHPDVGGSPEDFQRLDEAYRMLVGER
jgi:hypothetical protein